jgi:NarL family two-component system response regulator LiaR
MTDKIRILIVDDHAIIREGLRAVINLEPDLTVCGEAGDGEEAIQKMQTLQPDVIIMDLLMPKKDGIEATGDIRRLNPEARILVLTSFTDADKIVPTVKAGALGYIVKNSPPPELLKAIREVARGAVYLPPPIARQLFLGLSQAGEDHRLPDLTLTLREVEILKLIARGLSNQEIADQLVISERTVGVHVSHLMSKLGLNNRTQVALYALRSGLVSLFSI